MYELSEIIKKGLTDATAVTDVVGTNIFPLIADQRVSAPYIVYKISKSPPNTSKDAKGDYTVTILSFHNTYNEALLLNESVIEAMEEVDKDNKKYRFSDGGAEPYYSDQNEIYVHQIINIKL